MVAISAAGAVAEPVCTTTGPSDMALFTETCVETTTTTVEETEPATQTCQVGQSGRTGTQEGTLTKIYEVTTTTTTIRYTRVCLTQRKLRCPARTLPL